MKLSIYIYTGMGLFHQDHALLGRDLRLNSKWHAKHIAGLS